MKIILLKKPDQNSIVILTLGIALTTYPQNHVSGVCYNLSIQAQNFRKID
jgi:ABC-type sulfate transport system permease subunit